MNPGNLFFNRNTKLLRSGWRVLIFGALLILPQTLLSTFNSQGDAAGLEVFEISFAMIATYVVIIIWVVFISWLCLRFLDQTTLASLGYDFHANWLREILYGIAIASAMVLAVVIIQAIGGGTRVTPNARWWQGGEVDFAGLFTVGRDIIAALALLVVAGAFEELVYRGYPFQTLLRGAPAIVPILFFSILFGFGHWNNPNRTFFSTANTILAGVWLAVAYLKTRSLWFPTALHFTWNWMMGAFFGLPVSGLSIPQHPIFISTSQHPLWLTGGNYGAEGGAATSIVLIVTIFIISKSPGPHPTHHS